MTFDPGTTWLLWRGFFCWLATVDVICILAAHGLSLEGK